MNAEQLLSPWRFCHVLAGARYAHVRGSWEGSAFRSHPCGLLVGNMRLANHWHVDNYCDIVLGTTDKWRLGQQDSLSYGDPFPHPIDGEEIVVWRNGRWQSDELREKLEDRVVAILNRTLADTAAVDSWTRAIELHAAHCRQQRQADVTRKALAAAGV